MGVGGLCTPEQCCVLWDLMPHVPGFFGNAPVSIPPFNQQEPGQVALGTARTKGDFRVSCAMSKRLLPALERWKVPLTSCAAVGAQPWGHTVPWCGQRYLSVQAVWSISRPCVRHPSSSHRGFSSGRSPALVEWGEHGPWALDPQGPAPSLSIISPRVLGGWAIGYVASAWNPCLMVGLLEGCCQALGVCPELCSPPGVVTSWGQFHTLLF